MISYLVGVNLYSGSCIGPFYGMYNTFRSAVFIFQGKKITFLSILEILGCPLNNVFWLCFGCKAEGKNYGHPT